MIIQTQHLDKQNGVTYYEQHFETTRTETELTVEQIETINRMIKIAVRNFDEDNKDLIKETK